MYVAKARNSRGFTLIELMVGIAVLAIILALAAPSFIEFRKRAALRGAADQLQSFWAEARFEALKRNQLVKVGFVSNGTNYCIGAATTTDPADGAACDCLTAGACNISVFPAAQSDWRGVRLASATPTTLGGAAGVSGAAVIDPKHTRLTQAGDAGDISLRAPEGGRDDYRLSMAVDRNARAYVCEPPDAPAKLPQFVSRRCAAP